MEMIALLRSHPRFELGALESASHAGEAIGAHAPALRAFDRRFDTPGTVLESVQTGDAVVLAGSHGFAKGIAAELLDRGAAVVDLSGDFRLAPTPAVYGLPERYRDAIARTNFVANPGCYPTATLLATLPLAPFRPRHAIVDAKSGLSGAGRTPQTDTLFAEVAADIRAYGLEGHRHEAEILQEWRSAQIDAMLTFTPHVVPLVRGMLVNAYCIFDSMVDAARISGAYEAFYAGNSGVRVLYGNAAPSVAGVARTNDAEIHVSVNGNVVRAICAIDNLGRGAATQALVNLNLMLGFPEELGLHACALA